jgi:hypothetical protein
MPSNDETEVSVLQIAVTHSQSWFELHANQRQNLLNYYLIAAAFLVSAYVTAVGAHRYIIAAYIGVLGTLISCGFIAMDLRNRDLTRAGEVAVQDLEARLAERMKLPSLRIIEAVDNPRYPWLSMGKLIRMVHATVAFTMLAAFIYALIAAQR